MDELFDTEPLYLAIARWTMQQRRWICADAIAEHFDLPKRKVVNIVSYMISEVDEISCHTKIIPNELNGSGCQCQRLIKIDRIDDAICERIKNAVNKSQYAMPPETNVALPDVPMNLSHKERWQQIITKGCRK
jgi:transcriptional activator CaiF